MSTATKIAACLAMQLGVVAAAAQQRYTFSQHERNLYSYIPAAAGVSDAYGVGSAARVQPRGDSLAWQALALNASGPVNDLPLSIGVGVLGEQTDLYLLELAQLTGAYLVQGGGSSRLLLALSLGYARHQPTRDTLSSRRYAPDVGASAYFTGGIFHVGLSAQHLGNAALQPKAYLYGGAVVSLPAARLALKPSVLLSYMGGEAGADASLMLGWNNLLWLGGTCKTTRRAGVTAGVNILKKYMLTYSCDVGLGASGAPRAAHEVALGIGFETLRRR